MVQIKILRGRGGRSVRRVRCRYGVGTESGTEFGTEFGPYLASCRATYGATYGVAGFYISGGYQNLTCAARVQFKPCSVKPASCPRILLAKWAEFVLAARLLNLAGEPIEAVMNLGGMNKAKLNAIAAINSTAAPARLSVGPKAASPPRGLQAARANPVHHRAQLHQGQSPLRRIGEEGRWSRPVEPPLCPQRSSRCLGCGEGAACPWRGGFCQRSRPQGQHLVEPKGIRGC